MLSVKCRYCAVMDDKSIRLVTGILLLTIPVTCFAEPWGNRSLDRAIGAFLVTGVTYLFCLVYILFRLIGNRSYPILFTFTNILILWDSYQLIATYIRSSTYDQHYYASHHVPFIFLTSTFYILTIAIGLSPLKYKK